MNMVLIWIFSTKKKI